MDGQTFVAVLGWCSLINVAVLMFAALVLKIGGRSVAGLHARWFELDETFLRQRYFSFLAYYKFLTLVFNVVPWLALNIVLNS